MAQFKSLNTFMKEQEIKARAKEWESSNRRWYTRREFMLSRWLNFATGCIFGMVLATGICTLIAAYKLHNLFIR